MTQAFSGKKEDISVFTGHSAQGEVPVNMEEVSVIVPKPRTTMGGQDTGRSEGRQLDPREEPALPTAVSRTCGPQNREMTNFCCLSHAVRGAGSLQP